MHRIGCRRAAVVVAAAASLIAGRAGAASLTVLYTAPAGQASAPDVSAVRGLDLYGANADPGAGSLFRFTLGGHYKTLYTFTGGNDGAQPNTRLVIDRQGDIFGTTQGGGTAGQGTVFKLARGAAGVVTLYNFPGTPGGAVPLDGLAADRSGTMFGTASRDVLPPGNGEVFSITPTGAFTAVHRFHSEADGHCPFSGVVLGGDHDIYGTTVGMGFGGNPNGSVYALSRRSLHLDTLYVFTDGADGEYPAITPTLDHLGNVYGVTNTQFGRAFAGVVWTVGSGGFRLLHQFSGGADGYYPNGPLALGPDGNLYGTTSGGGKASGTAGFGVVFRITPAGKLTVLHRFRGGADGAGPNGHLAIDASGNVYGGTARGTIFEIMP